MLWLGFILLFVVIGLTVFFVAFRGGATATPQPGASRRRKLGRPFALAMTALALAFGVAIPALALLHNADSQAETAIGGVKLTAAEEHGRADFKRRCAVCHTLADAGAVGQVGPNLDQLRPATALTLDAIAKGRARGQGQMPPQLVVGDDAKQVAAYVAQVAGR